MSFSDRKRPRLDNGGSRSGSRSTFSPREKRGFWQGTTLETLDIPTNSWLFSEEEICKPDQIHRRTEIGSEITRRARGVHFIHNLAKSLNLSRLVAITASIYFHRFYMRQDITGHHYYEIGGASLFLACKAEECRRKLKDVVIWCARIAAKNPKMIVDEQTKVFWHWRDTLVRLEEKMLEVLCFDMTPTQPYKLCYDITRGHEAAFNRLKEIPKGSFGEFFFHRCCTFFECAARLPLCLAFRPEVIVATAMVLCAVEDDIRIPEGILEKELDVMPHEVERCLSFYHHIIDRFPDLKPYIAVKYPKLDLETITKHSGESQTSEPVSKSTETASKPTETATPPAEKTHVAEKNPKTEVVDSDKT